MRNEKKTKVKCERVFCVLKGIKNQMFSRIMYQIVFRLFPHLLLLSWLLLLLWLLLFLLRLADLWRNNLWNNLLPSIIISKLNLKVESNAFNKGNFTLESFVDPFRLK